MFQITCKHPQGLSNKSQTIQINLQTHKKKKDCSDYMRFKNTALDANTAVGQYQECNNVTIEGKNMMQGLQNAKCSGYS